MSIIVIKGVPKSGKTDFALFIAECLMALGLIKNFASNTVVSGAPIQYIDAMNVLKGWSRQNNQSKLFIYDEVIESVTNRRAMNDLNVEWVKFLPQISKGHLHLLVLVQQEEGGKQYYESVFLDPVYLRGMWTKEKRDVALFKSKFYHEEGYRLRDLPRTNICFDKDLTAHFSLTSSAGLNDIKNLPRTFQVAVLYQHDNIGYKDVMQQVGLTDKKQVQREIKKALRMLLASSEGRDLTAKSCNTETQTENSGDMVTQPNGRM